MQKLLIFVCFLTLSACAEPQTSPQFQPCDEPFNGASCPDDCWEVRQRAANFPECEASELLLGCASGPQTLPEYQGPSTSIASRGASSVENGLSYDFSRDYFAWLRANGDRFCTSENDPKCPEPDSEIVAECSE